MPLHDDEIEVEGALEASAVAHEMVGQEATFLVDDGVLTGVVDDYDVGDVELRGDVLHIPLHFRLRPDPATIEVTITESS